MPVDFPAHLYSFVPGRGFGVTPRSSHNHVPNACGTYRPLADDAPDPKRSWALGPSSTVIRLGPTKSCDAWINGEKPGTLLVMSGGRIHDAQEHGFHVLDLWSSVGYAGGRFPPPPIEIGVLQVGLALAAAWEQNPRVAVDGPAWALDMLAALPGVIVYETSSSRCDGGYVIAWGRQWKVGESFRPGGPFEIAARLSGPTPRSHDGERHTIGSMLFRPNETAKHRRRVIAGDEPDKWMVHSTDLGKVTIECDAVQRFYRDGPVVCWPSSEDPWLVDLVGDGEPIE